MKHLLLIIFLAQSVYAFSQNPYYDAIELSKLNHKLNNDKVKFLAGQDSAIFVVCQKYTGAKSYPSMQSAFKDNPFISFIQNNGSSVGDGNTITQAFGDGISSIGGLDVTNIVDGLAKFLVERTKKELSTAFFKQFKEDLDSVEELKVLFPNTHSLLLSIDDEIYNFSAYLNMLKETFQQDLQLAIPNLRLLLNTQRLKTYLSANPDLGFILTNSLLVAEELQNGAHPGDVISSLSKEGQYTNAITNFDPSVKLLNLVSQSLRSKSGSNYWVSSDSLQLFFKNETNIKLYLGLLYMQADNIEFSKADGGKINLQKLLKGLAEEYNNEIAPFENYLSELLRKGQAIHQNLKTIKTLKDQKNAYAEHYAFYTSALDLMKHLVSVESIPFIKDSISLNTEQFKKYFTVAQKAGDLYLDVREKKYFGAVINLNNILRELLPGNSIGGVPSPITQQFTQNILPKILKYGNLAASLAEAQSSDEVQQIIEAVAMPAGSYSVKRRSKFTATVNAYVGLSGGIGYNTKTRNPAFDIGVNTPIGVEFSWGKDKYDAKGELKLCPSQSLLISLIDIGAVTTYRFGDPDTEDVPQITLANILSPGVFYVIGFSEAPVSFGIGAQLAPQLHKVTAQAADLNGGANIALKAFIAVDLPLLNLKNTSR